MNYIINPMWFYWLSVLSVLKNVAIAATVMGIIACLICFIVKICNVQYAYDRYRECCEYASYHTSKKLLNKILVPTIICLMLSIFLPNKETLIEMQVAKIVTVDNVKLTFNAVKEAVDYIIQAAQQGVEAAS